MILVDQIVFWPNAHPRIKYWCHMVSTIDTDELHAFAASIGCRRSWYQAPPRHRAHYDLSRTLRERAVAAGATEVTSRELVMRNFDRLDIFKSP